jgi:hypothetical protein
MSTLCKCLIITTALLYLGGAAVVATDCIKRKGGGQCVAMAAAWPVTIPIAIWGKYD